MSPPRVIGLDDVDGVPDRLAAFVAAPGSPLAPLGPVSPPSWPGEFTGGDIPWRGDANDMRPGPTRRE